MENEYNVGIRSIPLKIDAVTVPSLPGIIGISSCPGMKLFNTIDLYDDRIENDLQCICNWGATVVVTLLELRELAVLGVSDLPEKVLARNLLWLHLPIRNMSIPDEKFEETWQQWAGPRLQQLLQEGHRILVHCREGIGRSGIVAVRLLIEAGVDIDPAMKVVRKARPGSLMLNSHEEYCYLLNSSPGSASHRLSKDPVTARNFRA